MIILNNNNMSQNHYLTCLPTAAGKKSHLCVVVIPNSVLIPLKADQKSINVLWICNTFLCLLSGCCKKGQKM